MVCSLENCNCIFHLCTECSDKTESHATLMTIFDSNAFDFGKQWFSNDKTHSIVPLDSTINEFIDILTEKISELCHQHFMKVQQSQG